MTRPTKNKQVRREALREELKSREYLRQIHSILESDWQPDEVAISSAKLSGYFRLLSKTLPDARESPVTVNVDPAKPMTEKAQAIIAEMLSGNIPPSQASAALDALTKVASIRVVEEFESRLAALERGGYSMIEDDDD